MHLILLIAFIYCVVHYGFIRGTGHFIFAILRIVALFGILIFGILLLVLATHYRL